MNSHFENLHPRDALLQTMERIYRYRMTTTSGGNLSIRDEDGSVWITPARVDKGGLRREDIARVRPDGSVEGLHQPSSEFPFHQAIYTARPDLRAVVHAHPVALVAFSICRRVPDTRLLHQARSVCGEVALAPYALPGSKRLGKNIADAFAKGFNCVILENHGVVVAAESLSVAFQRFETLEFTAKTIIKAEMVGEPRYLHDEELELPRKSVKPLPCFNSTRATSREKELRRELCEFVRRGYQQRLLISTEGSFSARVDEHAFLITPYRVDRNSITVDDIVLVRGGVGESGKVPSRASRAHAEIYARHEQIHAVVNAYTVNATAFSVTGAQLDSRTIPESYIFLREIHRLPYGVHFHKPSKLANCLSPEKPISILENDGVMVCGRSVLDAFDRLEVLESTAEAIINARQLGAVVPMSSKVIEELKSAFLSK